MDPISHLEDEEELDDKTGIHQRQQYVCFYCIREQFPFANNLNEYANTIGNHQYFLDISVLCGGNFQICNL